MYLDMCISLIDRQSMLYCSICRHFIRGRFVAISLDLHFVQREARSCRSQPKVVEADNE